MNRNLIMDWCENRPVVIRTTRVGTFSFLLGTRTIQYYNIDWGDGVVEQKQFNNWSAFSHTYAAGSGTKSIIIRNFNPKEGLRFYTSTLGDIVTDIDISSLIYLEKISFRYTRAAAFFAKGIPKDIFWNCKLLSDVTSCFQEFRFSQFTSVHEDLFKYNPQLVTVSSTFEDTRLETIPAGIFRYNPQVVSLAGTFRLSDITSLPNELFKYNKINSFGATFQDTRLTSVPSDLFTYWYDIIYLGDTFRNCTSLTGTITLPRCPNLTIFSGFIRYTKISNVIFPADFACDSTGVTMENWCDGNTAYNNPLNITWKITKLTFGTSGSVPIPSIRLLNPANPFSGTSPQIDLAMCRSMTTQALMDLVNDLPVMSGKTIKLPIANTTQVVIDIAVSKNWAVLTA